jgi:hypothetical protein
VARGENAGHTLAHTNVVRSFVTQALAGAGTARVPAGAGGEVIAFVQDGRSGAILGAARATP